jgi:hypothetical protein
MKSLACILLLFSSVIFSSCEEKLVFKSEKKLNSDLQGDWNPIPYTSMYGSGFNNKHLWRFNNGTIYIIDAATDTIYDQGIYGIDAKLENPTLSISGLSSSLLDSTYGFNIKWTLIQLDGKILDLAGKPFDAGLVEVEFQKR